MKKITQKVRSVKAETKGEDEDETGRLLVKLWMYNDYDDSVAPFTLVVEEDIAEGFEKEFSEGDNAILDFDVVSRHIGGKKSNGGFGTRSSRVVSGFNVTEYSIFNGKTFDDESDNKEYYIDEDDFKKLFKAHRQKCEEAKNASTSKDDKPKKGLGSARTSHVDDVEDDESPFDD